jgi:hypothetical protein
MKNTTINWPGKLARAGLAAIVLLTSAGAEDAARVPFPEGYRTWFHVKSATTNEGNPAFARFGGIHHIYANPAAMKGFESRDFPDGSVIVFDLLEFTIQPNQTTTEGARRHIDVMTKDRVRFKDTGGWGFEEFKPATGRTGVLTPDAVQGCFKCHAGRKEQGGVFSSIRQ